MTVIHDPPADPQEERALQKAATAALRTGTLPRSFRAMVTRRAADIHSYRRVAYQIERRTVALQVAPAHASRAREVQAPPSATAVDPWAVEPSTLPSASEAICTCLTCNGAKKVACPTCGASGRVRCSECGGGGKVRGQRGLKNCPSCRGQGTTKCSACTKGTIECRACAGVGRVRAWLEIRAERLAQVRAYPQTGIAALHKGLLAPEDFDRAPDSFRVPLAQDSQWIDALPESLGPDLGPTLDPRTDRVSRLRIQRFASTVHRFTYATRTREGTISVSGEPPALLPDSTWGPLWRRLALAVGAALAVFFVGSVVAGNYMQRAEWFRTEGNAGAMLLLVLVAAVAAGFAVAGQWMPAPARRPLRASASAWLVVAAWALIRVCWHVGGPTLARVEQAVARGELSSAHLELAALEAVGERSPRLAEVRAELATADAADQRRREHEADEAHLADVRDAPFAAEALARLARPWNTPELASQARALALLAEVVAEVDPSLAERAQARVHLVRASKSRKRADFTGAFAELDGVRAPGDDAAAALLAELRGTIEGDLKRAVEAAPLDEGDVAAQRQTTATALANARLLESRTGLRAAHTAEALQHRLDRLDAALEQERERAEAAERKRVAAEERARKKVEAAEQRRRAAEEKAAARLERLADRVRCCDGTLSPSCRYSQGSLRGCCSYHGGVC